jgi:hypothetical protein
MEKQRVSKKSELLNLAPYDTLLLSHLKTSGGGGGGRAPSKLTILNYLFEGIHRVTTVFKGVTKMIASIGSQHHSHWNACKNSGGENGSNYSNDRPQTFSCKQ